jgi:hypothetical protein
LLILLGLNLPWLAGVRRLAYFTLPRLVNLVRVLNRSAFKSTATVIIRRRWRSFNLAVSDIVISFNRTTVSVNLTVIASCRTFDVPALSYIGVAGGRLCTVSIPVKTTVC